MNARARRQFAIGDRREAHIVRAIDDLLKIDAGDRGARVEHALTGLRRELSELPEPSQRALVLYFGERKYNETTGRVIVR